MACQGPHHRWVEGACSKELCSQSSGPGCTQAFQSCGVSGVGVTVPAHGLKGWVNRQKHRGSLGDLGVREAGKEPRKWRHFLAEEPNRTWKPYLQASQQRGSPSEFAGSHNVLLFAPFQKPGTRESSLAGCVGMQLVLPQDAPQEASGPLCGRTER